MFKIAIDKKYEGYEEMNWINNVVMGEINDDVFLIGNVKRHYKTYVMDRDMKVIIGIIEKNSFDGTGVKITLDEDYLKNIRINSEYKTVNTGLTRCDRFSYDVYKGMFAVCCKNLVVEDKEDGHRIWGWRDGR